MARRVYTDRDRALVHTTLTANQGNVKRTSRETGIPIATVRDWKQKWEREGLPAVVEEALPAVVEEFTGNATRVRNKALDRLEQAIDANKVAPKDLLVAVGVLTDKVRLVEGKATSRTESVQSGALPVEQVRELFAGFAKGVVEAASKRADVISSTEEDPIDAEWEQAPPLALLSA
jgi:transposase-like protein